MAGKSHSSLVDQMTLEEQVSLLAGGGFWETVPIDRLGVPSIKVSDGPNGARGEGAFSSGAPAASFPVGISLASTWDIDLVTEIGRALAEEAKTKGARVILAPTVNLHRTPLGGRNFESFSEDPWLAGMMGAAIVNGLQQAGISASLKHFAGNESEFERMSIDSQIDERALRELYLRPFEIVVRQARPWTVMASYNRLNGTFASENHRLLTEILREEWGFDGLVMSDWTATRSTAPAINAGLDLEMPGPTKMRGPKLIEAAERGEASRTAIAQSAARMLQLIDRTGGFEQNDQSEERSVDDPRHRALIRKAGAQGIVLLANSGVLPIDKTAANVLAVVGPNAEVAQIMGGGSSQINAHYRVSPVEGIRRAVGNQVSVVTASGCRNTRLLPVMAGPMRLTYFANTALNGEPALTGSSDDADLMWIGQVGDGVDIGEFSVLVDAEFGVDREAAFDVGVVSSGPVRVFVDGEIVIDRWDDWHAGGEWFGLASPEFRGTVALRPGSHRVRIENRTSDEFRDIGLKALRLGIAAPESDEDLQAAVDLARSADAAIVCVGLNGEWDTEGMDRPHMDLPGRQNELVERVAVANPNTVVVLQSGGPLTMPWLDRVAAVLQAWYPGQECGNAIADVLFGDVNPSGKLPQTYPRVLANNPTALSYPGERGVARYAEGIYGGYRFYEKVEVAPLFPFGHGLSYTRFEYGPLKLSCAEIEPGAIVTVEVDITNVGPRAGAEIAQLYIRDPELTLARPIKELKGFMRLDLGPGDTQTAQFKLDMRALAYFDDRRNAWVADAGDFEVQVGSSSADIRARAVLRLTEEWVESARDSWRSPHV